MLAGVVLDKEVYPSLPFEEFSFELVKRDKPWWRPFGISRHIGVQNWSAYNVHVMVKRVGTISEPTPLSFRLEGGIEGAAFEAAKQTGEPMFLRSGAKEVFHLGSNQGSAVVEVVCPDRQGQKFSRRVPCGYNLVIHDCTFRTFELFPAELVSLQRAAASGFLDLLEELAVGGMAEWPATSLLLDKKAASDARLLAVEPHQR